MQQVNQVHFAVSQIFEVIGTDQLGVVAQELNSKNIAPIYYVAYYNDIKDKLGDLALGKVFVVECLVKGRSVVIPNYLTLCYTGDDSLSYKAFRRLYLSHLYHGPLYAARVGGEKSFDPKDVFAHPMLRLVESLHDSIHKVPLHNVLVDINYQYNRLTVYTRLPEHSPHEGFNTPRSLTYFPMERVIRTSFTLGGVPEEIQIQSRPDKFETVSTAPARVNIMHIFRNEGWTSLRDQMKADPKLNAFVRMFYENGYGAPVNTIEHTAKIVQNK